VKASVGRRVFLRIVPAGRFSAFSGFHQRAAICCRYKLGLDMARLKNDMSSPEIDAYWNKMLRI
jgi:hypothetical protein